MRADRIGRTKKERRLRTGVVWVFLSAGLFTITLTARLGGRSILAQTSTPAQTTPSQESAQAGTPGGTSAQQPATDQQAKADSQAKPDSHDVISDPKKREIADQSANLLKLANSLKADVDKTTADTLSVSVIREADEIEKLARKMRSK